MTPMLFSGRKKIALYALVVTKSSKVGISLYIYIYIYIYNNIYIYQHHLRGANMTLRGGYWVLGTPYHSFSTP